jgi:hypothetical protein
MFSDVVSSNFLTSVLPAVFIGTNISFQFRKHLQAKCIYLSPDARETTETTKLMIGGVLHFSH